ncbi:MAG: hypothetical protein Q4C42_01710 [Clostridia bacterium]|nr:hypothetical protein [Clostridia bacterium]
MAGVQEYKCPFCGAPIGFAPGTESMNCMYCGSLINIDELTGADIEKNGGENYDEIPYSKVDEGDRWAAFEDFRVGKETMGEQNLYECQSCGAEIYADLTTVATKCPYCDNNVILRDKVSGKLRPDKLIPFAFGTDGLKDIVKKFHKGKPLLPKGFLSEHKIEEVQGVYVPFWLYDADVYGGMVLRGETVRTHTEGDYKVTETNHFALIRDGGMSFANVPVDASVKMDNDLMDSIEPFDMSQLVDFNDAYLSGFLADMFDDTPENMKYRATFRINNSAADAFKATCRRFTAVRVTNNNLGVSHADMKYVLLPVYLINDTYNGKKYTYAVNGQTGKIVGELPSSKLKKFIYWASSFVSVSLIAGLIALFFGF